MQMLVAEEKKPTIEKYLCPTLEIHDLMCHAVCGTGVYNTLNASEVKTCINNILAQHYTQATLNEITITNRPASTPGAHQYYVALTCKYSKTNDDDKSSDHQRNKVITTAIEQALITELIKNGYNAKPVTPDEDNLHKKNRPYRRYIFNAQLAAITMLVILGLYMVLGLATSIPLLIFTGLFTGLLGLHHIVPTLKRVCTGQFTLLRTDAMRTGISIGWLLSIGHMILHSATIATLATLWMSCLMPISLMLCVNLLDALRDWLNTFIHRIEAKALYHALPKANDSYQCLNSNEQIPYPRLQPGMRLQLSPHTIVPADCKLLSQTASFDTAIKDGERDTTLHCGNTLCSGYRVNGNTTVDVEVLESPYRSTLTKLMMENHIAIAPSTQRHTAYFSLIYTLTILFACLLIIGISLLTNGGNLLTLLNNLSAFLFSLCPCTVAIAHQLPSLLARYRCSQEGVVDNRNDDDYQPMAAAVFDKTGTLTQPGKAVTASTDCKPVLLAEICTLEAKLAPTHVISKAILRLSDKRSPSRVTGSKDAKGRGIIGTVGQNHYVIGNEALLMEHDIKVPQDEKAVASTRVFVALNREYCTTININLPVRSEINTFLHHLKRHLDSPAIKKARPASWPDMTLITGDTHQAAEYFNKRLDSKSQFDVQNIQSAMSANAKKVWLKDKLCQWQTTITSMSKHNQPSTCQAEQNDNKAILHAHPTKSLSKRPLAAVYCIGDGFNDAAMLTASRQHPGSVACAMSAHIDAALFADVCLNDKLSYLLFQSRIFAMRQKVLMQNQGLLVIGNLAILFGVVTCCISAVAIPMMLPLIMMTATTVLSMVNSYRTYVFTRLCFQDTQARLIEQLFTSDASYAMMVCLVISFSLGAVLQALCMSPLSITLAYTVATISASALLAVAIPLLLSDLYLSITRNRSHQPTLNLTTPRPAVS